jgi:hypothetical protein
MFFDRDFIGKHDDLGVWVAVLIDSLRMALHESGTRFAASDEGNAMTVTTW